MQELDPPPGDGVENPAALTALTDGDPATAWTTVCYESRYLYPKSGIGLVLGLSGPVAGQRAGGWQWQHRSFGGRRSTPPPFAGSEQGGLGGPGSSAGQRRPRGTATFSLGDSDGRYVLVWLTRLAANTCCANPYQGAVGELASSSPTADHGPRLIMEEASDGQLVAADG